MTPQLVVIKMRLRLNKLHSQDYDNVEDWKVMEAVNKAQLELMRKLIHGSGKQQEADEQSRVRIDDLQQFLLEVPLGGSNKTGYFQSDALPDNYLWFKKVIPEAEKGNCQGVPLESTLVEEANVPVYMFDWNFSPSFEWRQTFHTLIGNSLRVYTGDNFQVQKLKLTYYRTPHQVDIAGYTHEDATSSSNQDMEFKDDVAEIILDMAASILAADVEYMMAAQITAQRAEQDN